MSYQGVDDKETSEESGTSVGDIYTSLDVDVSEEKFREQVQAKVEQMGGLCDEITAAKLVSHEIGGNEVRKIDEIHTGLKDVKFAGKVLSVGEARSFDRDDGSEGMVANLKVGDETGRVRVSLWDEYVESIDELDEGQVLKIAGTPKEGYSGGVEVSASHVEPGDDVEIDVSQESLTVEDVEEGLDDVTLEARVLSVSDLNTFERDDGSKGKVSNLVVGDNTDWIRVTLWDERAPEVREYTRGDAVRVIDGYVKERDGTVELHVGNRGRLEKLDREIEFSPETTAIEELEIDTVCSIGGVVTDTGELRRFDRDDGSEGRVRNVRVRDGTGEVRVAFWGEHADTELAPGDEVVLTGVEIKEGWNGGVEGSLNWNSTVSIVAGGEPIPEEKDSGSQGLDSFT